jgi:hypothetical protein
MQTDLESCWHRAENHYLDAQEISDFRQNISVLEQRLITYKILRDQEGKIWQAVVDRLEVDFSSEDPKLLERALKHWISILRYGAMAMLLNHPDYLRHRLLEWLTDIVKVYQMQVIEGRIYDYLGQELQKLLTLEQYELLQPFLMQAKILLLTDTSTLEAIL